MPLLPFSKCAPPGPPDTTCTWLAEAGEEILATALDGLLPFIPPSTGPCAAHFDSYLTMGPPVAARYDALSVYLVRYGLSPRAVAQRAQTGACTGFYPQTQAVWEVQLWETCWPIPRKTEDSIVLPNPDTLQGVAEHTYAHGLAWYNALLSAITTGSWTLPHQIGEVVIGDLIPLGPNGAMVGWKATITTLVGR